MPPELARRARTVAAAIRSGELGPKRHAEVVALLSEVTEASLRWFFERPVEELGGGPTLRATVRLGASGATRAIRLGLGRVLPRIRQDRWCRIADYIEESIHAERVD